MIARILCLFKGHHDQVSREPQAMRLRCDDCGRETAGWHLDAPAARLTQHGIQQRHVLVNPRLMRKNGPVWWVRGVIERRQA